MQQMVEINWLINDCCNFNCVYCYPGSKKNEFIGIRDIDKIADGFKKTGLRWLIYISGGEPFLSPNFLELCQQLTKDHIISINSNITHHDVYRFAELINPAKVRCIHCSLHIVERERLQLVDDFIKKYKYLESKGFYLFVSYVLYPNLINRFRRDYAFFKSKGIILRPKLFRGSYNRVNPNKINFPFLWRFKSYFILDYPGAYSTRQKENIISYIKQSTKDGSFDISHKEDLSRGRLSDVYLDTLFIDGYPSFRGKYCMAGKEFVRMTPTGEVYRCYNDNYYFGNLFERTISLFEKPTVCTSNFCTCPYIGYRHVLTDKKELDGDRYMPLSVSFTEGE